MWKKTSSVKPALEGWFGHARMLILELGDRLESREAEIWPQTFCSMDANEGNMLSAPESPPAPLSAVL
jgi:hypothetical protein